MAAPTISTVPIRVQIDKSQRCTDFLAKLQAEATEMIPFEQTGLQNIIKSVRSSQYSCKFQTQLVVQTGADHCNECPFGEWQQGSEEQGFITYAFTLELWLHSDRIATTAMFDSRAIEPWLVRHMVARLSAVMDQLTKALPTQTLSDLEICVPEDLNQIWEWNEAVPTAIEECVHDIFQKQVQVNPDAPAIVAWDGHLTYGQLDELSHRVAEKLISLGVEGEVVVPVCFEKSMWTVVAILGVIKAGGGFVMLDPTLPELRLKEIVQQVEGKVVLSSPLNKGLNFSTDPVWLLRGAPGKPGRRGRLYKTGDLVKYNENGSLTYVCRKDDQVKVRGQRVELGEIEHALRSQEYIDEAVAILQGESKENAQIASFVTIHDEVAAQEDQLEDHEESEQQIKSWEVQFDGDTYSSMEMIQTHEIGRDFVGWSSMIDGEELIFKI
ncbi:hypothetical protein HZS61_015949 [Fusarium oxysporum f. sp. conglutinans]|uniref:AMP-dependent synthetase/ligase domain-containing protein n=1 Tax=Fusarium oxysporum f. sp. conglutinans TaxID=100902 RepID=A0A8H6GQC4_FUSOX|nr:hypothetical protein HZS61_015949 [Fusarium oxysporum f. sp. conglutinans]